MLCLQYIHSAWLSIDDPGTPTESVWLSKVLPAGSRVGVDPQLMSYDSWHPMQTQLEASGMSLVPVHTNLIDAIWEDRPAPPCNVIHPHPFKYSGSVFTVFKKKHLLSVIG